ncbi:MAG: 50S ribosomal protein L9 [Desulfobacteraceae bacterium]|jgi:large subunit ribosomal protein L9|nr:50S ribosomal protein L9 [Desulfobacteraceae bacterium]
MKVIFKETIEPLGIIGSEVDVKNGFARNFLIPRGKAVFATPQNRNVLAQEKVKLDLQIAKERATAEEMAKKIESVVCKVTAKVAEENRLYGSVTTREIMDALIAQDVDVLKRMILLKDPIKELGTYKIPIRIYKDIEPEITLEVTAG